MSGAFYTSDLHFGHGVAASHRGFEDTSEHDQWVLDLWRSAVRHEDDIVYVLGDLSSGRTREREEVALDHLATLPGRKRLIAGNHDTVHPMHRSAMDRTWMARWLQVFEIITPIAHRRTNGRTVMLSHFPYDGPGGDHTERNRHREWRPTDVGLWLVHGHTHRAEQRTHDGRQVHVGLDAWRRLVPEHELIDLIDVAESDAGGQQAIP